MNQTKGSELTLYRNWMQSVLPASQTVETRNFMESAKELLLHHVFDVLRPGALNWKKIDQKPTNYFRKLSNLTVLWEAMRDHGIVIVSVRPSDVLEGKQSAVFAVIWNFMRLYYTEHVNTQGSVEDNAVLQWASKFADPLFKSNSCTVDEIINGDDRDFFYTSLIFDQQANKLEVNKEQFGKEVAILTCGDTENIPFGNTTQQYDTFEQKFKRDEKLSSFQKNIQSEQTNIKGDEFGDNIMTFADFESLSLLIQPSDNKEKPQPLFGLFSVVESQTVQESSHPPESKKSIKNILAKHVLERFNKAQRIKAEIDLFVNKIDKLPENNDQNDEIDIGSLIFEVKASSKMPTQSPVNQPVTIDLPLKTSTNHLKCAENELITLLKDPIAERTYRGELYRQIKKSFAQPMTAESIRQAAFESVKPKNSEPK